MRRSKSAEYEILRKMRRGYDDGKRISADVCRNAADSAAVIRSAANAARFAGKIERNAEFAARRLCGRIFSFNQRNIYIDVLLSFHNNRRKQRTPASLFKAEKVFAPKKIFEPIFPILSHLVLQRDISRRKLKKTYQPQTI